MSEIADKKLFAFMVDVFNIGNLEWWLALFEHAKHTNLMEQPYTCQAKLHDVFFINIIKNLLH